MLKEKTVCFTGHRPEKFTGCPDNKDNVISILKSVLYYSIEQAINDGFEYFITGMAEGVDLWAGEYVLELKKKHPNIHLICAVPYPQKGKKSNRNRYGPYAHILKNADDVICISPAYHSDCFKNRNYYMVEHSARLICVIQHFRSGTAQTFNYAKKRGLQINYINAQKCFNVAEQAAQNLNSLYGEICKFENFDP